MLAVDGDRWGRPCVDWDVRLAGCSLDGAGVGEGGGAHATAPSVYRWPASVQIRGLIRKYANRFGEVGKGEDKQGEKGGGRGGDQK